jgi:flagellar biosynthesis anti-sigma factor FlgM
MRINSNQAAPLLPESGRSGSAGSSSTSVTENRASASSALGEDSAQLSGAHVQVQALVAQALQFPEVRQEKVAALRQAVLSGSYQPTSQQVAGAVLAHLAVNAAA